jgi:hypothetical protein
MKIVTQAFLPVIILGWEKPKLLMAIFKRKGDKDRYGDICDCWIGYRLVVNMLLAEICGYTSDNVVSEAYRYCMDTNS